MAAGDQRLPRVDGVVERPAAELKARGMNEPRLVVAHGNLGCGALHNVLRGAKTRGTRRSVIAGN